MSPILIAVLAAANVLLIYGLMAAPLGRRTVRIEAVVAGNRERVWNALWPFGKDALWSGQLLSVEPVEGRPDHALTRLVWNDRNGEPMERLLRVESVEPLQRFAAIIEDDSSLDRSFWEDYREEVELADAPDGVRVVLSRTDRYRGLAFLIFRYFALRREMMRLKSWAATGSFPRIGLFERPLTQVGFAALSALILWPLFGLTAGGLIVAVVLTSVVALHELGHMAAFRLAGHRNVRMIFIPLIGGIAIGSRPYDSRFEVAFVALMGAGFSAFLVPVAIASSDLAGNSGMTGTAAVLATFAGCAALFNVANLVPVWRFDGGQVLRQICPSGLVLSLASFAAMAAFLALGYRVGFSPNLLVVAGVVFAILSLVTAGSGAKLKGELKPIVGRERLALGMAFAAVFAIHASGLIWAAAKLT